jgi:hypothetical protein
VGTSYPTWSTLVSRCVLAYVIDEGTSRGANQAYAPLQKILEKRKRNTLKINNKK